MLQEPENKHVVNGVNTTGLKKTVGDIKGNPELAKCRFRVCNNWKGGDENHTKVLGFYAAGEEQTHGKTFEHQCGEPLLLEGRDKAANPAEYLLTSLSGCMTTVIAYYAALNDYTIEEMESNCEGDVDLQGMFGLDEKIRPGYQNIRIHFKIKTDAPKAELEKYCHFSPVFDVVSKSVPVEVEIETC